MRLLRVPQVHLCHDGKKKSRRLQEQDWLALALTLHRLFSGARLVSIRSCLGPTLSEQVTLKQGGQQSSTDQT